MIGHGADAANQPRFEHAGKPCLDLVGRQAKRGTQGVIRLRHQRQSALCRHDERAIDIIQGDGFAHALNFISTKYSRIFGKG